MSKERLLDDAEQAMMSLPKRLKDWFLFDASVNWDPIWALSQFKALQQEGYSADACVTLIIDFLRNEERKDLARLSRR